MATKSYQGMYFGQDGETPAPNRIVYIEKLSGETKSAAQARMRSGASTIPQYPALSLPGTPPASNLGLSILATYVPDNSGTVRLDYTGTGNFQLKIERQDGQAMSLFNAQNPSLQSGTYYPPSPDRDWTFSGVPTIPVKFTITKDGANPFSINWIPVNTVNFPLLAISSSTSSAGTTSSTPTTSSAPITPGNPMPAGGFAEGNFNTLLQYAPFIPQTNQLSGWPQGNITQYINGSQLSIGLLKSVGAALTYLARPGGENLINTNANGYSTTFEGSPAPDVGRSAGFSLYGSPTGFEGGTGGRFVDVNEYGQTQTSSTIGWNGVHGGSENQDHSPIRWFERRTVSTYGEVLYTKTQPYQWGMVAVLAKMYIHQWWWVEGQATGYHVVIENFRDDNQKLYIEREQELPFIYPIAPLYRKVVYGGNAPFTGGGLTYFDLAQPTEGGGSNNQNDTGEMFSTENWVGAVNADGSKGVFLVTPYTNRYRGKQFQSWAGNEYTNASSYINASMMMNYDHPSIRAYRGYIFAGSISEFRSWILTKNITPRPFSFNFAAGQSCDWTSENGYAKFNGQNKYEFAIGAKKEGQPFASFRSPFCTYKASDIPTLYIDGIFNNGVNQVAISWKHPNNNTEYTTLLTVIGDGTRRTYTKTMSGIANWDNYIIRVEIKNPYPFPTVSDNATFVPYYIGNVNPSGN